MPAIRGFFLLTKYPSNEKVGEVQIFTMGREPSHMKDVHIFNLVLYLTVNAPVEVGSLPHYLQGFSTIQNGGWPWDSSINSSLCFNRVARCFLPSRDWPRLGCWPTCSCWSVCSNLAPLLETTPWSVSKCKTRESYCGMTWLYICIYMTKVLKHNDLVSWFKHLPGLFFGHVFSLQLCFFLSRVLLLT